MKINKKYAIPLMALLLVGLVSAVALYFHSTTATLVVDEARSSADVDFSLNAYSGETKTQTITIHNNANVPLCAEISYEETANEDAVSYTTNLPQTITLAPEADTTATASFAVNEVSSAGTVTGTIYYTKVACA